MDDTQRILKQEFRRYLRRSKIGDKIALCYGEPARDRDDFFDKWIRVVATEEDLQEIAELYAQWSIEKEET